jgi:predicted DNA-binding transcriptional regulator AlpA
MANGVSSLRTLPNRLNRAAKKPHPRVPRAGMGRRLSPPSSLRAADHDAFSTRTSASSDPHCPEGESPWTNGCAGRFGGLSRTTCAALALTGTAMPAADEVRSPRERDKLTIAEVCAAIGISRRTSYEWRAKGRAPRCITLPNGSFCVRRSEYQRWLPARWLVKQ